MSNATETRNYDGLTINIFRPENEFDGEGGYSPAFVDAANKRMEESLRGEFPGAEIRHRSANDSFGTPIFQGEYDQEKGGEKYEEYFEQWETAYRAIEQRWYEADDKELGLTK